MAARARQAANRLNEFPQSVHENRFSAAAAANKGPEQNLRSKSFHGKCVCDICTCGKHSCPPSVSPTRYPADMRSTSQDNFRAYKPSEIRKANTFAPTKSPAHKETEGVFPTTPQTKEQLKTSNQLSYPNHWANKTLDPRQLRYSPTTTAYKKTFDIFPNEPVQDQFQPLATKPQNQRPVSPHARERSPSATSSRGRTEQRLPRRANDVSPDFPLNQPVVDVSSSHGRAPPRGDRTTGAVPKDQDKAPGYYGEEEQGPRDASDKRKTQPRTPPAGERRKWPVVYESQGDIDQTIKRGEPKRGSGRVPLQINPNFESIVTSDDQDSLVPKAKKDRYGPAKGLPRPQTNQQRLTPHNRDAGSPPKHYAGLATKRPKDTNIISHEQPSVDSGKTRKIQREPAIEFEEIEGERVPMRLTPKRQPGAQAEGKPLVQSEVFNPFDEEMQRGLKTPTREQRRRPEEIEDETARKSPLRTSTPTRMKRENDLHVDRSLPLVGGYEADQLKPRGGTGQISGRPAPSDVRESEDRAFGKIKSLKYNDIKTVYQDDFKEVMVSNFMKKDCPIMGLPKPPKIITTGKLHVYYDEEENDWN